MVILVAAPVAGLLMLYFGTEKFGETRNDPVDKIVRIDGLGTAATLMVFQMTDIEYVIRIHYHAMEVLVAAKTIEDLENIPLINLRSFSSNSLLVLLPPFIAKVL